jgi:hypothetical protein
MVGKILLAFALAGCAVDVEPGEEAPADESVSASRQEELISVERPKCKQGEQLCCPRGGPACSCIPEQNTCSGGFVVSPSVAW